MGHAGGFIRCCLRAVHQRSGECQAGVAQTGLGQVCKGI